VGVPNLPGVPQLVSYATSEFGDLLTSDGTDVYNAVNPAQWGIFLNGANVVVADTVATFDFKQEWSIADYPLEEGAFASYDKVQIPFDVRFRFTSGGSEANRAALINSIAAISADSTNLYTAVTPEASYASVTVTHTSYSRNKAVGLLSVDVWVLQVNVQSAAAFQNTQSPSGAAQMNEGTVAASSNPTTSSILTSPTFPADSPTFTIGEGL
jgi:hypothetical protein